MKILFLLVMLGLSMDAHALELKPLSESDRRVYYKDESTIVAFEKEYSGKAVCTSQAMNNPDEVARFEVVGSKDVLVVLCTSTLDGEENSVTVFKKGRPQKTKRLNAQKSSYRISEGQLKQIVEKLAQ